MEVRADYREDGVATSVESLRVKQRESEKDLENFFSGLMQRAFRGELAQ